MTPLQHTIHAISLRRKSGKWMARQYAMKHGVMRYYRLACQLDAARDVA